MHVLRVSHKEVMCFIETARVRGVTAMLNIFSALLFATFFSVYLFIFFFVWICVARIIPIKTTNERLLCGWKKHLDLDCKWGRECETDETIGGQMIWSRMKVAMGRVWCANGVLQVNFHKLVIISSTENVLSQWNIVRYVCVSWKYFPFFVGCGLLSVIYNKSECVQNATTHSNTSGFYYVRIITHYKFHSFCLFDKVNRLSACRECVSTQELQFHFLCAHIPGAHFNILI